METRKGQGLTALCSLVRAKAHSTQAAGCHFLGRCVRANLLNYTMAAMLMWEQPPAWRALNDDEHLMMMSMGKDDHGMDAGMASSTLKQLSKPKVYSSRGRKYNNYCLLILRLGGNQSSMQPVPAASIERHCRSSA